MEKNSTACYEFNVPEKESLELSMSKSWHMIKKYVIISAEFPSQTISIEESEKNFSEDSLKILCSQA